MSVLALIWTVAICIMILLTSSFLALIVRGQNLSLWNYWALNALNLCLSLHLIGLLTLGFFSSRRDFFQKSLPSPEDTMKILHRCLYFVVVVATFCGLFLFHVEPKIKPLIQYSSFLCGPHLRQRSLWCSCTLLSRYHWERSPAQFS